MGYDTYYRLTWNIPTDSDKADYKIRTYISLCQANQIERASTEHEPTFEPFDEISGDEVLEGTGKWYDRHKDMIKLSEEFSDTLFTLNGEGEEPGDLWRTYYNYGFLQHAHASITFPEFDVKRLLEEKNVTLGRGNY